ncbi:MAG: MATE family efflux transporter [Lachnospiraceae bacterium]|nr:MATE family efflux transporter [Lachnospiraceae bacterium]
MKIQLSDHFTYSRMIRFTLPSIAMMIFSSVYGVVDGFFVSNYVGGTPFAALNLVMPFIMIMAAVGFMFGTGGSALVAVKLGMGEKENANGIFSLIIYLLIAAGLVLGAIGFVVAAPVARRLGATEAMLPYCVLYARINMLGMVPLMLQFTFQSFFIVAEKPKLGLYVTLAAGCTNMFLDWLFMGALGLGLESAAAASVTGMIVGGVIPLIYFGRENSSLLKLGRPVRDFGVVARAATNGASEFMSNISVSVVSMMYNHQLLKFAGERGVSAYGIIMYTNFIFIGVFFGFSVGISPVIGYHYGTGEKDELKNLFGKCIRMIAVAAMIMLALSELLAGPLAMIFAGYDETLLTMTTHAIRIYSLSYIIMGFNIFGSALFTALNNGLISAMISCFRTLLFQLAAVLILPVIWGLDGIWLAIVAAETCAVVITVVCIICCRRRYGYY